MQQEIDLLIQNANIWCEDGSAGGYQPVSLAVNHGTIVKIESGNGLSDQMTARQHYDAGGKLLLPGFINSHCHLFQTFMRGLGKDLPFIQWMNNSVRIMMPQMDEEAVYLAAMAGCMEAIRTGTTTVVDFMYANVRPHLSDAVLRAFDEIGIRGFLARGLTDVDRLPGSSVPPASAAPVSVSLKDHERLRTTYKGHPRIDFMIAPSVIWGMTADGLREVAEYAQAEGMVVTMHLLETVDDDNHSIKNYGKRTTQALKEFGILDCKFLAVHTIRVDEEDLSLFKEYGTSISHNPVANMILGSGVAPICEFVRRDIPVSLGTDGAASNDSQNLLEVIKSAALLQKVHQLDTAAISARQIMDMATRQGARAIRMDKRIGTLEPGKKADFLVVDLAQANTTPSYQPISSLVYSGSERNMHAVFVEGECIYEKGSFTRIDESKILAQAQEKAISMLNKAKEG